MLADPVQQRGVTARVGNVEPAGQDGHGDAVAVQHGAVRRAVDAIGAAGDHRDVALGQPGRQFAGDVLAVGGRGARPDHGGGPVRDLIEPHGSVRPQRHRRNHRRSAAGSRCATPEGGERQQRPLVVVRGDQPPATPGEHLEIGRTAVDLAACLSAPRHVVVDQSAADPLRGLHRADVPHQGGEFGAGRLGHPGQIGPRAQRRIVERRRHRRASGFKNPPRILPAPRANVVSSDTRRTPARNERNDP